MGRLPDVHSRMPQLPKPLRPAVLPRVLGERRKPDVHAHRGGLLQEG